MLARLVPYGNIVSPRSEALRSCFIAITAVWILSVRPGGRMWVKGFEGSVEHVGLVDLDRLQCQGSTAQPKRRIRIKCNDLAS